MRPIGISIFLGALCLAAPAHAVTVEIQGTELYVAADTVSVRNEVAVTPSSGGEIRVADSAGVIAVPPCVAEGPTSARCPAGGLSSLSIFLGPLDDELTIGEGVTLPGSVVDGGNGADLLEGSDLADEVFGALGADILKGDGGNDFQKGGPGNDRCKGDAGNDDCLASRGKDICIGGVGADECDGGPGRDRCVGGPGTDFGFGCELLISMLEPNF